MVTTSAEKGVPDDFKFSEIKKDSVKAKDGTKLVKFEGKATLAGQTFWVKVFVDKSEMKKFESKQEITNFLQKTALKTCEAAVIVSASPLSAMAFERDTLFFGPDHKQVTLKGNNQKFELKDLDANINFLQTTDLVRRCSESLFGKRPAPPVTAPVVPPVTPQAPPPPAHPLSKNLNNLLNNLGEQDTDIPPRSFDASRNLDDLVEQLEDSGEIAEGPVGASGRKVSEKETQTNLNNLVDELERNNKLDHQINYQEEKKAKLQNELRTKQSKGINPDSSDIVGLRVQIAKTEKKLEALKSQKEQLKAASTPETVTPGGPSQSDDMDTPPIPSQSTQALGMAVDDLIATLESSKAPDTVDTPPLPSQSPLNAPQPTKTKSLSDELEEVLNEPVKEKGSGSPEPAVSAEEFLSELSKFESPNAPAQGPKRTEADDIIDDLLKDVDSLPLPEESPAVVRDESTAMNELEDLIKELKPQVAAKKAAPSQPSPTESEGSDEELDFPPQVNNAETTNSVTEQMPAKYEDQMVFLLKDLQAKRRVINRPLQKQPITADRDIKDAEKKVIDTYLAHERETNKDFKIQPEFYGQAISYLENEFKKQLSGG